MTLPVSHELKKSFENDGFVYIPKFLNRGEIDRLKDKLNNLIKRKAATMPPEHAFFEDKHDPNSLKQMFHLSEYDPYFESLLNSSRFKGLAETLLGEKTAKGQVEYFNKPPGIGKPTPPHQDSYYFMLTPPSAITFWLPLEDVDQENGCLHYIRGSHLKGMRPHGRTSILGFSQGITDFGTEEDRRNDLAVPAQTGDVLIHHGMTVHYAEGNNSNIRSRKVVGFVYFGESAKEDIVAKEAYLKKLREEKHS